MLTLLIAVSPDLGNTFKLILQDRTLRHLEFQYTAEDHTTSKNSSSFKTNLPTQHTHLSMPQSGLNGVACSISLIPIICVISHANCTSI